MATNSKPGTALAVLANRLQVSEAEVKESLTQTVFKGASDAQMTALCIVANEYGLNPFVKELYAFPSQTGIVPMVSIDGWLRIINEHAQFAGMDIVYAENVVTVDKSKPCPEYIEVTIHRKDRPHTSSPIREYLDECYRSTQPWNGMTRRMLRHKAIMQAARVVMGLHGIFDEDEAADVLAREGKRIVKVGEDYEVIDAVPQETGEVIGQAEYDALLRESERTQVSLEAVAKNVAAKAGYTGALEDMPMPVWQSLMTGLSQMPSKGDHGPARTPGQERESGDAGAQEALEPQEPPEAVDGEIADDEAELPGMDAEAFRESRGNVEPIRPPMATTGQLQRISSLRKSSRIYDVEYAAVLDKRGVQDASELTKAQAEEVIGVLKGWGA